MRKRVVIYGASGFIGSGLASSLAAEGYEIIGVSRKGAGNAEGVSEWVKPEAVDLRGCSAIINLAGAPIDQRWTEARKIEFHASRVGVTEEIVTKIAALPAAERPELLLNGSAVGFYGDGGDAVLSEDAAMGEGYLAELCEAWEKAALPAEALGVRLVLLRTGVVLGKGGQAFEKLMTVFKLGIGGRLGNGKQWMPWIHVDDLRAAMVYCLRERGISGAVNGTAPEPETNAALTRKLAKAVGRWEFLPVPGFALKLALGSFGGFLLASQRAVPAKLTEAGFRFRYPTLQEALHDLTK
jgi:uncharacterized protein (TIGR01777 family)